MDSFIAIPNSQIFKHDRVLRFFIMFESILSTIINSIQFLFFTSFYFGKVVCHIFSIFFKVQSLPPFFSVSMCFCFQVLLFVCLSAHLLALFKRWQTKGGQILTLTPGSGCQIVIESRERLNLFESIILERNI